MTTATGTACIRNPFDVEPPPVEEVALLWKQLCAFTIPMDILILPGMAPIGRGIVPAMFGSTPNKRAGEITYNVDHHGFDDFFTAVLHARATQVGMNINDVPRFTTFVNRMLGVGE